MAQKWNLQDIVPPDRGRRSAGKTAETPRRAPKARVAERAPAEPAREREESRDFEAPSRRAERMDVGTAEPPRLKSYLVGFAVIALVVAIGFGITAFLRKAEVRVTPKTQESVVQGTLTAKLEPASGELGYEVLTLEEGGQAQVKATGEKEVSLRAEGTITVYNEWSTTPQRLITNTRFEAPDGRIYRISESVDVPGYTKGTDGAVIPGSITADVFAEGAGESYNIQEARFSVPGLKGTEQYEHIYAKTNQGGIQGGFEGMELTVDDAELAVAREKLHEELRTKLLSRIQTERPNGFTFFEPSVTFSYESLPPEDAGGGSALIKEQARIHAPLFSEAAFAAYIAKATISGYSGESVRLENPGALTFAYTGSTTPELTTAKSIDFSLSGTTRVIWNFDRTALANDLKGLNEDALLNVLNKYPAISKAEAVIRPVWKNSFPEDPEEITITEVISAN